ncbi:group II intron reverse transcriptase/maturase [Planctomyces sp. SH-PL62]|uniref:group II intron reverse transcriptase/maturase n=1 Tax=Planctomyces sp. SH-PL62 TaxID=1636152 RepID=UPI00078DF6BA|nr:group II intron reverse transcriptase/maturase [Planctomyces sp. SH-PL62]AMV41018.1 Group II intron-encoded protein LtrA [Planctomyces sp. SH-PL62]
MSLAPPPKVRRLQGALHAKAKGSPDYRFYSLYDKVYRRDVLEWAYVRRRANDGAPGVDRRTFEEVEAYGLDRWLDELAADLKAKSYRPLPVRRVFIPKGDGKRRPLGIGTIRDRVAQMAVVLVLEPIFEADLEPEQYAYRADRSALDAVQAVHGLVATGHTEVVDADLSGYFDGIPHAELMKSLSRRISDRLLLGLIKMWLEAPVEEVDGRGRRHRTTRSKDEGRGTPQGSPLSPLLSNVYMRRFVRGWKTMGHERRMQAYVVNYADDFVICCRGSADEAMAEMRGMMSKLRLTINEAKTRRCRVPEESFDFLGYTIGRCHSPRTGRAFIGTYPSAKKVARLRDEIRETTDRRWLYTDVEDRVARLNRKLLGWSNYFRLGPVSRAYRAIDRHSCQRLRRWLCAKHKVKNRGMSRFPDRLLFEELGLIRLSDRTRDFPWAKA